MSPLRTVVTAVDFSDSSMHAVDVARELVCRDGGRLHLVHVLADTLDAPWLVEAAGADFAGLEQRWREDAERQISSLAASRGLDPECATTAIVAGSAAAEIVRYAREHAADVIVLGSHGHGPIRHFVLGSVADRVIRLASCPVLVVPFRSSRANTRTAATASGIKQ